MATMPLASRTHCTSLTGRLPQPYCCLLGRARELLWTAMLRGRAAESGIVDMGGACISRPGGGALVLMTAGAH